MSDNPEALTWWTREVAAFRAELRRLDCVHLDSAAAGTRPNLWTCVDYWLHPAGTFIDLDGNYVPMKPVRGVPHGFLSVTFHTWIEDAGGLRLVFSLAEKVPRPKAPGLTGFIAQGVLHPVGRRLLPPRLTLAIESPADLASAIATHLETVARSPGTVFQPPGNALDWRWQQVAADEGTC